MWPSVLQITHRFPAASDRGAGHRAWAIGPVQRKPFGSLSWREETGTDYDLEIAEQLVLDWFASAIKLSPDAHTRSWPNSVTSFTSTARRA